MTLAHQYLAQLDSDLRAAVLNTAGTIVCFRVSHHDAALLSKEIFPSADFLKTRRREFKMRRMWPWPLITVEERDEALHWDGLAQCLVNQRLREFWLKRRGHFEPVKLRTLDMPGTVFTPELVESIRHLRDASGGRFGRLKSAVQRELARSRPDVLTPSPGTTGFSSQRATGVEDSEIPFWGN